MRNFLKLMRVIHWPKNLLVFAGVVFAGKVFSNSFISALLVFFTFCIASSCVYIVNDITDKEQDKKHPIKKKRPLASGKISTREAKVFFVFLFLILIFLLTQIHLTASIIILIYFIYNVTYTYKAKHIPVVDLFYISLGFIFRVLSGTIGINIPPSSWLLITVFVLSMYLAIIKRKSELALTNHTHRKVLKYYNKEFLDSASMLFATLTISFYSIYIISERHDLLSLFSIVFVLFGFLRYNYLIISNKFSGDVILDSFHDTTLLITVILWILLILVRFNL